MIWIDVVWAAILLSFAGVEAWTVTNDTVGDTFTERTRRYFRTDTRTGARIFFVVLGTAAAWFSAHIVTIGI